MILHTLPFLLPSSSPTGGRGAGLGPRFRWAAGGRQVGGSSRGRGRGVPPQAGGTAAAGGRQAGGRRAAAAAVVAAGFRPGPRRRRMAGPPSLRTSLSLPPSRLLFPSFPVLHRRLLERRRLSESLSLSSHPPVPVL